MALLTVRKQPSEPGGPPCPTCAVPLEEGATVCPHCGRRLDRPVRSAPLYQRKQRRRKSMATDVVLLVGSLVLIMGVLVLALVPFLLRDGGEPVREEASTSLPTTPEPVTEPAPPARPIVPAHKPIAEAPATVSEPEQVIVPDPPPRETDPEPDRKPDPLPEPIETVVVALPLEPPADASLDDLLKGFALGQDLYWNPLAAAVRERVMSEADDRYPMIAAGTDVAVRGAGGQVVRGPLLGLEPGTVRIGTTGGETSVPTRELAYEDRLRLDPAYREEVIDARVTEYLFSRLPVHRRGADPPPGSPAETLAAAARRGSVEAACRMGLAYLSDVGQDPDHGLAFAWLVPAAKWGDPEAQYLLGVLYYEGTGVLRDERMALGWMGRSSGQGHEPARQFVAAHWQRKATNRRMEEEAAQALESHMKEEAAWLEEAATRPPVTLFKRGSDGVTVGAGPGLNPAPGR